MTPAQIATLSLAIVTGLVLPLVIIIIRGAIKWTRVEAKLDHAVTALNSIVADKDKVHTEIFTQMREDREATNKRLRWLEEHLWRRGAGGNPRNAAS